MWKIENADLLAVLNNATFVLNELCTAIFKRLLKFGSYEKIT